MMRKVLLGILVAAVLVVVPGASPGSAQTTSTACPQMSDSIFRLYRAFFLRDPDPGGFSYWVGVYQGTNDGLPEMANNFVVSNEFVARYGALSNAEFVDLVYQNVLGRPADAGGRAHWTAALDRGFPRGSVMISFSESEEYVIKTNSAPPAAGYLQWFQGAVRYTCSAAGRLVVTVNGQVRVDQASLVPPRATSAVRTSPATIARGQAVTVDVGLTWDGAATNLVADRPIRVLYRSEADGSFWAATASPGRGATGTTASVQTDGTWPLGGYEAVNLTVIANGVTWVHAREFLAPGQRRLYRDPTGESFHGLEIPNLDFTLTD